MPEMPEIFFCTYCGKDTTQREDDDPEWFEPHCGQCGMRYRCEYCGEPLGPCTSVCREP